MNEDLKSRGKKYMPILAYALIILSVLILLQGLMFEPPQELEYSRFLEIVEKGQVYEASISESTISGKYRSDDGRDVAFKTMRIPEAEIDELILKLREKDVSFSGKADNFFWSNLIYGWILPVAFFVVLWFLLIRRVFLKGGAGSALSFGKNKAMVYDKSREKVTFNDVAGLDEAKQELSEIIGFLKEPTKYAKLGARIPKGVIVIGPPGTGKTLLARALAGEANVPFFAMSGAHFMEIFVGVGASRIRDLFEQARKNAPCIVFIDEIDTIAKTRSGTVGFGGADEREQTLNQLLAEMDGFESSKGVIILAATNRPEVLDPAVMRPGRFDRQIVIDKPDINGREAILGVHTKNVKLSKNVDLRKIAARTPGFAGAELANIVNEAALLAGRRNSKHVEEKDLEEAIDRGMGGLERKSRVISEEERKIVAYHEIGHAMVATMLPGTDPVHKVSIIPRGVAALGMTMQMPSRDRYILTYTEFMNRIAVLLGGRVSEEVAFGEVSSGAQNDLQIATEMARKMVIELGMSEKLGPMSLGKSLGARFLESELSIGYNREYSERTAEAIDEEIKTIVEKGYALAKGIIQGNEKALHELSSELMQLEIMEGSDFRKKLEDINSDANGIDN